MPNPTNNNNVNNLENTLRDIQKTLESLNNTIASSPSSKFINNLDTDSILKKIGVDKDTNLGGTFRSTRVFEGDFSKFEKFISFISNGLTDDFVVNRKKSKEILKEIEETGKAIAKQKKIEQDDIERLEEIKRKKLEGEDLNDDEKDRLKSITPKNTAEKSQEAINTDTIFIESKTVILAANNVIQTHNNNLKGALSKVAADISNKFDKAKNADKEASIEDIDEAIKGKKSNVDRLTQEESENKAAYNRVRGKKDDTEIREGSLADKQIKANEEIKRSNDEAYYRAAKGAQRSVSSAYNKLGQGTEGVASSVSDFGDRILQVTAFMGPFGKAIGFVTSSLLKLGAEAIRQWSKMDVAASDYARQVGGGGAGKNRVRERAGEYFADREISARNLRLGLTQEDFIKIQTDAANAVGRAIGMSNNAIKQAFLLDKFGINAETQARYQKFGTDMVALAERYGKLYGDASRKGLSFTAVSKAVNENISKANEYTFANGLRGLTQMAEKSVELGYNMQMVFNLANKVSNLQGAIEASANLSVLGGNIGMGADPLAMMGEALTNVESLQDRIQRMVQGSAYWDSTKNQFDIRAFDRVRLRSMAEAAGVDYGEATNMALNQARREAIRGQLGASGGGFTEDQMAFLLNKAQFRDNGQAYYVDSRGREINLNNLRNGERGSIQRDYYEAKRSGENFEEVYDRTMSMDESLKNIRKFLEGKLAGWMQLLVGGQEINDAANASVEAIENRFKDRPDILAKLKKDPKYHNVNRDWNQIWQSDREIQRETRQNELLADYYYDKYITKKADGDVPNVSIARGPSHAEGGIKTFVNGRPAEIEGGEAIINKRSTEKYNDVLSAINNDKFEEGNIKPIGNGFMGSFSKVLGNGENVAGGGNVSLKNDYSVKLEPLNITVNGSIKLDLEGKNIGNVDASSIIMNNPIFMKAISDEISKYIGMQLDKGYNKDERLRMGMKY